MVWNFGNVLGCVVLLVLIKFLIVAMVMKSFGFSWGASTLAGACMAQVRTEWRRRKAGAVCTHTVGRLELICCRPVGFATCVTQMKAANVTHV